MFQPYIDLISQLLAAATVAAQISAPSPEAAAPTLLSACENVGSVYQLARIMEGEFPSDSCDARGQVAVGYMIARGDNCRWNGDAEPSQQALEIAGNLLAYPDPTGGQATYLISREDFYNGFDDIVGSLDNATAVFACGWGEGYLFP